MVILEFFTFFIALPVALLMAVYAAYIAANQYTVPQSTIVTVSENIIQNSQTHDPHNCMIANALSSADIHITGVGKGMITTSRGKTIFLPLPIREKINAFDRGEVMQPFQFMITHNRNKLISVNDIVENPQLDKMELLSKPSNIEVSNDGIYWFTINDKVENKRKI